MNDAQRQRRGSILEADGKRARDGQRLRRRHGVHLGRRASAPALFSVALRDQTCPPSTVFAAHNHYGELAVGARPERDIEVYEFNQHEGGTGFQLDRQLRWFADVLASAATSPVTR